MPLVNMFKPPTGLSDALSLLANIGASIWSGNFSSSESSLLSVADLEVDRDTDWSRDQDSEAVECDMAQSRWVCFVMSDRLQRDKSKNFVNEFTEPLLSA
jgi:hypothetical protein